jgi:acetyl-CoA carboxylase carboxyltransferase component
MIRRFLSYMPQNVYEAPPKVDAGDPSDRVEEALLDIVPAERRRAYDMRRIIDLVCDRESAFEIQPDYGKGLITALARLDGHVVGVVANNPMVYGGAMDAAAANKQCHFVELCDTFHIPLIFLVDVPGFMVGEQAERAGVLRAGMRAVYVASQARVPVVTVVIRKCYGMAGMATCHQAGLNLRIAWPSAEPKQREAELEAEIREYGSPFRTAEAFGVEDIVDPRETRAYLCRFINAAQGRIKTDIGLKPRAGVRP